MHFTIREMTAGWFRHAGTILGLGVLLAFLGPFRSAETMSPAGRALFWIGLVASGYLFAIAASRFLRDRPQSTVGRAVTVALLAAIPQTFVVGWALQQVRPGRVIAPENLPMLFLSVLSIQVIIVALKTWGDGTADRRVDPGQPVEPLTRGRLASAVPGPLLALESEDHYVRVHHPAGSNLLLYRLGDAIADVRPDVGLQVHRGWWVASDAVAGTFVRGDKRWLLLTNGLQVPVSRTYSRAVLDRHWPRLAPPSD